MSLQVIAKHFLAALFVAVLASVCAPQLRGAAPVLQVIVYDYAGVSTDTLAYCESEAQRLLRNGGVDVHWLNCPHSEPCATPPNGGAVMLRLVTGDDRAFAANVIGFALPAADGGNMATVFYDRAMRIRQAGIFTCQILGKVMAHEIAHLLLGGSSHAPVGVMRSTWTPNAFGSDGATAWFFTARQAAAMRGEALRREMEAGPLTGAPSCLTLQDDRR
jgi:hypothetical protein